MVSIRHKTSSVPGKAPLPADLERAEIAVNLADRQAYTKDQTDAVVKLASPIHESQDLDETLAALGTIKAGTLTTGTFTPGTYTGVALTGGSGTGVAIDLTGAGEWIRDPSEFGGPYWQGQVVGYQQTYSIGSNEFVTRPTSFTGSLVVTVEAQGPTQVSLETQLPAGTVIPIGTTLEYVGKTGTWATYQPTLQASITTPGSGYTVGDVLTIPDGTLGTGSTGNTYTVDQVVSVYADAPAGSGVVVRDPAVADGQPGAYKLATINTDAASLVPDLKDVTVKAAAPYDEPADDSGYLTRIGGKAAGDADAYQLTRVNLTVGETAPASPHVGMQWIDTKGLPPVTYTWSGVQWIKPGEKMVMPGVAVASYDIETDAGGIAQINPATGIGQGVDVLWGDGAISKAAGGVTSHTYAVPGVYTIDIVIRPNTTGITDAPSMSGATKLRKIGPFTPNATVASYFWGTTDVVSIDFSGLDNPPTALFSGQDLFYRRKSLMPADVKGVDWSLCNNISHLIQERLDIEELPAKDWPEVINMDECAYRSGIKRLKDCTFPKATVMYHAFTGCNIDIVDNVHFDAVIKAWTVNAVWDGVFGNTRIATWRNVYTPLLEDAAGWTGTDGANQFTHYTRIDWLDGPLLHTGPALTTIRNGLAFCKISRITPSGQAIFSDTTNVVDCSGLLFEGGGTDPGAIVPFLENMNLGNTGIAAIANAIAPERAWNLRATGAASFCDNRMTAKQNLKQVGVIFSGACTGDLDLRGTSQITDLQAGMLDAVTSWSGWWFTQQSFNGINKLTQESVDNFIKTVDVIVAAGVPMTAGPTLKVYGGGNAAPSAAVTSGAVARLVAAGWTVQTN